MILRILLLASLVSACATQSNTVPKTDPDGLQQVRSSYFDAAFVRPGTDFTVYKKLMGSPTELAFTTPDRSKRQFPLEADQKKRFQAMLDSKFRGQLVTLNNLTLSPGSGPDVLELKVRVQDILTTIPPNSAGKSGWGSLSMQALAEATMVVELRDSESGELLARAYDHSALDGVAIAQGNAVPFTKFQDVEAMCEAWAATLQERLDALVTNQR